MDRDRLDNFENFEIVERRVGLDLGDLRVADDHALQAVVNPDDGFVAVDGPPVNGSIF